MKLLMKLKRLWKRGFNKLDEQYIISKQGLEMLKAELEEVLQEEKETQLLIGESVKMDNDLRENPDYMQLQTKAMFELKYRLEKIRNVLARVTLLEEQNSYKNFTGKTVIVGSVVTLYYEEWQEKEKFTILGYGESNIDADIISYLSPLGQALIGKEVGDKIVFKTEEFVQNIKICSVERWIP